MSTPRDRVAAWLAEFIQDQEEYYMGQDALDANHPFKLEEMSESAREGYYDLADEVLAVAADKGNK